MYYVYHIRSIKYPTRDYTGYTSDLKQRLEHYNDGCCDCTRPFKPWKLIWYSAFEIEQKARDFERYLKSGSGQAFGKKRFW